MKEAIIWSVGALSTFHMFIMVMCFITWENGYRVLGKGCMIRFSIVVAFIPIIAYVLKLV